MKIWKILGLAPGSIYLTTFGRDMEDTWFGSWKYLLLGGLLEHSKLESLQTKLLEDLKSTCELDVDENKIEVITRGGGERVVHQELDAH
ncbi:hypothetical protein R6Q59_028539 [Mikania micrantha]